MNGKIEHLRGRLIVSCQALPGEPLHSSFIMGHMTLAAKESGVASVRASAKEDIAETQKQVDLPVVGIIKRGYEDNKVYITPTVRGIEELMGIKPEIIVLDTTLDLRPGAKSLDEPYWEIRAACPDQLLMADCSTVKETPHTGQLGFDFIGTTLVGYTGQNRGLKIESDDFFVIREIVAKVEHRIIAGGNTNIPGEARRVIKLGVFSVVVGSAITRPQLITRSFVQAVETEGQQADGKRLIGKGRKIMTNLEKYRGIIPAPYTCYNEEDNVSPERVRALTKYHIKKGVKGTYVNGSLGECVYQNVEGQKTTLGNVVAVAKGKLTVIARTACNNTKGGVELIGHVENLGVDTTVAISSIHFRLSEYAIVTYWNTVSEAASNTDFITYNIPQLAGVALAQGLSVRIRQNLRVVDAKNSSMPAQDIQMPKAAAGKDYIIFSDPDKQFISSRAIGAKAGIGRTYSVMPEPLLKMGELVRAGELGEIKEAQYAANEAIYRMCSCRGNMYGIIKEMPWINKNLNLDGVREPLPQFVEEGLPIAREATCMVRETVGKYC